MWVINFFFYIRIKNLPDNRPPVVVLIKKNNKTYQQVHLTPSWLDSARFVHWFRLYLDNPWKVVSNVVAGLYDNHPSGCGVFTVRQIQKQLPGQDVLYQLRTLTCVRQVGRSVRESKCDLRVDESLPSSGRSRGPRAGSGRGCAVLQFMRRRPRVPRGFVRAVTILQFTPLLNHDKQTKKKIHRVRLNVQTEPKKKKKKTAPRPRAPRPRT